MFALNLLGGAVLEGRNGPVVGRAAHKRRLALLAILAAARGRSVGRERIIGLLWPEHPTDAARHLLSESLYVLRKELGEGAFVSSGDEVGLNGEVVRSDVEEFERSVEAGELEAAAKVYRGPFLDGFYVSDAPEFERWAESERDRLARVFTRALESLAEAHTGAGRPQEAAAWWRRLAVHDPYNSRVGMRLMLALDAAGERAAALWFADTHATLLREELGVEPDPEFAALVERLKTEPVRLPPVPAPPSPPTALPSATVPGDEEPEDDPAESAPPAEPEPPVPVVADPAPPVPEAESVPPPAVVPRPVPTRRLRHLVPLAGALGVLAGLSLSLLFAFSGDRPKPQPAPRYDPRRIAVLYLDDYSPGGKLQYLADGLTEMLIHDLSQVEALDVVSRNGVKPYRDRTVLFDSMVADLRVGSVVEGSVQGSGDSVRVTVQLIDANTKSHLESRTIVHPVTELFTLEDALAEEVSGFLRRRLGREIELRKTRAETQSVAAWEHVLQAEALRGDAASVGRSREPLDAASADLLLLRADSLLALAEREDPDWTRPVVLRGWVALRRSRFQDGYGGDALLADAFARADRVLAREPRNPLALELRGNVDLLRASRTPGTGEAAGLERAERDLRAAVAVEPSLASAWGTLSKVLRFRGHFAESDLAAKRALAEDAYLEDADDILHRLFFGALLGGDYRGARAACDQGRRRFPRDWRFVECRLTLMREDASQPPDPELAWRLVAELDRLDPPAHAREEGRAYSPIYRRVVTAALLARAGRTDSARAVLARAQEAVGSDAELRLSLEYDEAYVRLLMGERETARRLLDDVLARRPALRPFVARDPLFRGLVAAPATAPSSAGSPASRARSESPRPPTSEP
ncbi:MAG: hypothetical protein JO040_02235 [Gemmatimonadetes bacterium]|nr:hypothetical protein [Gemmatimonadota bacterium]